MQNATLVGFNTQVVCVGAFNPSIVSPDWLAAKNLIGDDDLQLCRDSIQAHGKSRLMVYQCKWFRVQILANQLSVASLDGATPRIKDLAAGILQSLPETPVQEFGINFDAHYKVHQLANYHRFGDFYVPKAPFTKAIPSIEGQPTSAGLLHLSVVLDSRSRDVLSDRDQITSQKRITIEPSNAVSPGIYFLYNNHVVAGKLPSAQQTTLALATSEYVVKEWEVCFRESQDIFERLIIEAIG